MLAIQADLATDKGVADVVMRTVETFGGLDILVNNVGLAKGAGITDTTDAEWQEAFDQTLVPAIRASRMAVPHMRRRGGGSIVMIASIWGRESGGRMTYNAVKAAEISLAKSMAQQLARDNIRVNSVAPGSILFPGGSWDRRQRDDPAGNRRLRLQRAAVRAVRPPRGSRGGRRVPRVSAARAGSAGQVCPLTAASHAPRSDFGTRFVGPALRRRAVRPPVKCLGAAGGVRTDADRETFGVFVLTGVGLGDVGRVKEETSAPHSRLVYIHLQMLLA